MNTFGRILRLTTFGESHGVAIGGVLDGMPAGLSVDFEAIQAALARRRPGQSSVSTTRREEDRVEFLSGIFNGKTLGTPIGFIIRNQDQRSSDYDALASVFRPSHADYTYQAKYGIRDARGGGRASARETAIRVVAGALAAQLLATLGVEVLAYTSSIGGVTLTQGYLDEIQRAEIEASIVRCPEVEKSRLMQEEIHRVQADGDSVGGVVSCIARGLPTGWGEPIYDKLSARLASAMLSINAARAFELGNGWAMASSRGSLVNDEMTTEGGVINHRTNHSGGVLGGISNSERLRLKVAFKPTATIAKEQTSANINAETIRLSARGRHDPCVVPRAVPVVEAMVCLVLADFYLLSRSSQPIELH
ncbi:chorismate synthase [Porphyromonas sp. COT-290 OH860]|uniref:chorismate synthase n=1 Tax=Porphyromonas sp. COT-290 OH860 TaxID=1515615 RepID=UPI00052E2EF0|nr:chorismate synthase [Porphyromonas sp. COT-290 OH860]KGN82341.1 chorismate synthase [Porphyromonas sp. COT-290 OH860]